jgi:hypothetical protein
MATKFNEIVGYQYQADNWCRSCFKTALCDQLHTAGGKTKHAGYVLTVEELLDGWASGIGLDRYREDSFDSDRFPKVIFHDMDSGECGGCGEVIR